MNALHGTRGPIGTRSDGSPTVPTLVIRAEIPETTQRAVRAYCDRYGVLFPLAVNELLVAGLDDPPRRLEAASVRTAFHMAGPDGARDRYREAHVWGPDIGQGPHWYAFCWWHRG